MCVCVYERITHKYTLQFIENCFGFLPTAHTNARFSIERFTKPTIKSVVGAEVFAHFVQKQKFYISNMGIWTLAAAIAAVATAAHFSFFITMFYDGNYT